MLWPAWDRSLFLVINGFASGFLTSVMRSITNVDNWIPFLAGYILMLLWWGRTRPRPSTGNRWKKAFALRNPRVVLLCLIVATAGSDQVCYHLKHGIERQRPCFDESLSSEVNYRGDVHGSRSFPSAHSANSAALAAITSFAYPPLAPFAATLAFLVGFSRIYLGVHYPIDVLTGWGIGFITALGVWLIFRKMVSKQGLIGFTNRFRYRQPVTGPIPDTPWQPVDLESLDGYKMKGYFLGGGDNLAVMVHGLNEDIGAMLNPGRIFEELGFSVLLVPLRGHDDHPVAVTSGGPSESYDLAGALIHARDNMGFDRRKTVIYGSSMGGAVAMKTSGLLCEGVAGVIASGVFRNFFEASCARMGKLKTALLKLFLPVGVKCGLKVFLPSDYIVQSQDTGFVYINGSLDRLAPPEIGKRLAGKTRSIMLVLEGTGHPSRKEWSKLQMGTAIKAALKYIRGVDIEQMHIDRSGNIRNYPGSSDDVTRRE